MENISRRTRIIVISRASDSAIVQTAVRQMTGNPEWLGSTDTVIAGIFPPDNDKTWGSKIVDSLDPDNRPFIHIHPEIFDRHKNQHKILQKASAQGRCIVYSSAFSNQFKTEIKKSISVCGFDYESRLAQNLIDVYGRENIEEWKRQFDYLGFGPYGEALLSSLVVFTEEDLRRTLCEGIAPGSFLCVLNEIGSDAAIIRVLNSMLGTAYNCKTISEITRISNGKSTPILLLDSIHSGEQLIHYLKKTTKDAEILVRPFYATRWGLKRVNDWLAIEHRVGIRFDLNQSKILENLLPENSKIPEIYIRLSRLGYEEKFIRGLIDVIRRIGAALKQIEDQTDFPELQLGLGGFSLGLCSLLGGYPGKGVLPVVRLSGKIECTTQCGEQQKVSWVSLVQHKNTSGAG